MLQRSQRLRTKDFDALWKRGTTMCGAFVCVRAVACAPETPLRCACVVPRKTVRSAARRNRQRRRLYALVAALRGSGTLPAGDLIITARTDTAATDTAALRDDIAATADALRRRLGRSI